MESHASPLDRLGEDHVASTAHFTLYSHPWVNLQHLLYQWARQEAARLAQRWPPIVDVPERGHMVALPQGILKLFPTKGYTLNSHLNFAQNSGGSKQLKYPFQARQHWFCEGLRSLQWQLHDLPLFAPDLSGHREEPFDNPVHACRSNRTE
jgi:hypothetical protein